MSNNLPPIKVFAGSRSHYLGESICKELGIELGKMNIQHFAEVEFDVCFEAVSYTHLTLTTFVAAVVSVSAPLLRDNR